MFHHHFLRSDWREENVPPFHELILSWNGARPLDRDYEFYVRVQTDRWSPWLLYACWGKRGQTSFSRVSSDGTFRVYQDVVELLGGKQSTGFEIRALVAEEGSPAPIEERHVYTDGAPQQKGESETLSFEPVYLPVPGSSQMTLNHPRHRDLCSPVSTASIVEYLLQEDPIDPLSFARNCWDQGFDLFGNWVFNVAEASSRLGNRWSCWVERLADFTSLYRYLKRGTPVVISVRGPLQGSALPYSNGHLIGVIGYDPLSQNVLCMDPAFPSNSLTRVSYPLFALTKAWSRRGNIAYLFFQKESPDS